MKIKGTHLVIAFLLAFALGFVGNDLFFKGELPIEFPLLFGSAMFFVLASYNKTAAKMRNILFALVLVIGIIWFVIWINS